MPVSAGTGRAAAVSTGASGTHIPDVPIGMIEQIAVTSQKENRPMAQPIFKGGDWLSRALPGGCSISGARRWSVALLLLSPLDGAAGR